MNLAAHREIARPADEVFSFLADASNNPRWQSGMQSCEWTDEPPIGTGSRYRQVATFMGRPVVSVFEVSEFEPGRTIRIDTLESTFPISVIRTVTPIDSDRCAVTADISGGPNVPRVLQPLVRRLAQRSVDRDYDRLVALLEA